jgi:DnaJ-class molecular chaperone
LVASVKVHLVDALCGHRLGLTGIDGKHITQSVPRITPGMELTLPGEGMPRKSGGRGSLRVKFDIEFPSTPLSDKQKEELRRILK